MLEFDGGLVRSTDSTFILPCSDCWGARLVRVGEFLDTAKIMRIVLETDRPLDELLGLVDDDRI